MVAPCLCPLVLITIENPAFFAQCWGVKLYCVIALLATGLFVGGCKPDVSTPTTPAAPPLPTQAQPRLQTIKLWVGSAEMITELALTGREQQTGMMFRTNMAENEGMLFPFARPERASFWMSNTFLPLSAAYLSPSGEILEIHDLKPNDTNEVVAATDNILYVLETPQGWFTRNHVSTGAVITSERGPLNTLFSRQR
jgi:uncharacterized membrane protein (UPF0127 family)